MSVVLPGHAEFQGRENPVSIKCNMVEPGYFRLFGIRLLRGRVFQPTDTETAPRVAVISNSMARRYWPGQDPVGRFLRSSPDGHTYQIAGVVADAPINEIGEVPEPYLYTCWWQNPMNEYTFLIQTEREAAAFGPTALSALAGIRPEMKHAELFTMDQLIRDATIIRRATAQLAAALTGLGLLLAALGLYGVVAHGVALRTREIGIRMALGARERETAALVVRQAAATAGLGIAAGMPCSLAANWAIRSVLFGVSPWDPRAFLGPSAILLVVGVAAGWIPARRAARVSPLAALRHE